MSCASLGQSLHWKAALHTVTKASLKHFSLTISYSEFHMKSVKQQLLKDQCPKMNQPGLVCEFSKRFHSFNHSRVTCPERTRLMKSFIYLQSRHKPRHKAGLTVQPALSNITVNPSRITWIAQVRQPEQGKIVHVQGNVFSYRKE